MLRHRRYGDGVGVVDEAVRCTVVSLVAPVTCSEGVDHSPPLAPLTENRHGLPGTVYPTIVWVRFSRKNLGLLLINSSKGPSLTFRTKDLSLP